ncbi:MAG: hypothetical protein ACK4Q5_21355 [Saprospiraceae bacterium]
MPKTDMVPWTAATSGCAGTPPPNLSPLLLDDNESRLLGVGHLSSGNNVAGGAVLTNEGSDLSEEAWLLKIGIDGCTEPGDCAPKVPARGPVRTSALKWLMFPNPVNSHAYRVLTEG